MATSLRPLTAEEARKLYYAELAISWTPQNAIRNATQCELKAFDAVLTTIRKPYETENERLRQENRELSSENIRLNVENKDLRHLLAEAVSAQA